MLCLSKLEVRRAGGWTSVCVCVCCSSEPQCAHVQLRPPFYPWCHTRKKRYQAFAFLVQLNTAQAWEQGNGKSDAKSVPTEVIKIVMNILTRTMNT